MSDEAKTKTYEIVTARETIRITIPDSWKVTYGPIIGAGNKPAYSGGLTFRVWESDKLQRGLWTDVVSFRDLSIPIQVAAVRKFGSKEWRKDDGTYTGEKALTVERAWMSIDEIVTTPEAEDGAEDFDYIPFGSTVIRKKRA